MKNDLRSTIVICLFISFIAMLADAQVPGTGSFAFGRRHPDCSSSTQANCLLSSIASGGSSGACAGGYTGACSYKCFSGQWSSSSNSCVAVPTCGGYSYGGGCWYLGAAGASCDTACAGHGGYNSATLTVAGSGGNLTNCVNIMAAFGVTGSAGVFDNVAGATRGCYSPVTNMIYRWTDPTDSSNSGPGQRACACNN